jgi:glycosyltransferase involved in cell wall biosynthesis
LPLNHQHFSQQHPDLTGAIFILYDSWVYNAGNFGDTPIIIWAPIDHITMPPEVARFLKKDNVTVVAMSPDGQRQLEGAGIKSTYIPHTIDTRIYKPTQEIGKMPGREYLKVSDDEFLVGMVAANKSNGLVHRKAFAENILGFSMFQREHPDAKLYIHSEPSKLMGGFNLINLLKSCGVKPESVIFPDPLDLRFGIKQKDMAGMYTALDVLLTPSYGEGFGVPTIEAQACGTRVIASSWAASQDLVSEDGWLVDGIPFWDEPQTSWFKLPNPESISSALAKAYAAPRGISQVSVDFAQQFDDRKVWAEKWHPFLGEFFASKSNNSSTD